MLLLGLKGAAVAGERGGDWLCCRVSWHSPPRFELFDPFDGEKEAFLVTQLEEADIFQVFDGDGGHVGHAAVALVVKLHPVLAQSDLVQPVFQRVLKHKLIR